MDQAKRSNPKGRHGTDLALFTLKFRLEKVRSRYLRPLYKGRTEYFLGM